MRVALALVFLGACGGPVTATDAGNETDATVVKDVSVADASIEDATIEDASDACDDACCLKGGTICGNVPDAAGCAACCADAWGQIPKTIDYACAYTKD